MFTGHRLATTLLAVLITATGAPAATQAPATSSEEAVVRAHVDAFFTALASGHPETFEAMAASHCTPAFLERRPAAQRAEMLQRLRDDFGTMTLDGVSTTSEGVVLAVRGSTGLRGRVNLTLEDTPARRIDRFGIELGSGPGSRPGSGPGDGAPPLPPPPVTAAMSDQALDASLDAYLSTQAKAGEFSGVVLVARSGRKTFVRAYGDADRDAQVGNTPATRFSIGSINKSFTQVAIAQLIAAGRLKPTDTIGSLLPDYPNADARAATVQQLLDHRGGIADFFGPAFAVIPKDTLRTNADYFRLVASQPLTFAPGTSRTYCNGCYIVLGEIVARVSGRSYETYVTDHMFTPAGMRRTFFLAPAPRPVDVAYGFTTRAARGGAPQRNTGLVGAGGSAAGGAYSTAEDLLAYVDALRSHRLLGKDDTARLLGGEGAAISMAIAGGAPGLNALVQASADAVVVVLANLDPPHAERLGEALARQLAR